MLVCINDVFSTCASFISKNRVYEILDTSDGIIQEINGKRLIHLLQNKFKIDNIEFNRGSISYCIECYNLFKESNYIEIKRLNSVIQLFRYNNTLYMQYCNKLYEIRFRSFMTFTRVFLEKRRGEDCYLIQSSVERFIVELKSGEVTADDNTVIRELKSISSFEFKKWILMGVM